MNEPRATVGDVFAALREQLGLEWTGGHAGTDREIRTGEGYERNTALVGHLNPVYPNRIQIVSPPELRYLEGLADEARHKVVRGLLDEKVAMVVVTDGAAIDAQIKQRAEEAAVPLLTAHRPAYEVINRLEHFLAQTLAERITVHGVLMEVLGIGILITGPSGVGKSELALELVSRGHRLIADDAAEMARIAPDIISGRCPDMLMGFMEVRGMGVLNIRAMYGETAVKPTKNLRLVINLQPVDSSELATADRLHGSRRQRTLLDVRVPEITLPVAPGRNLAVLVEAAVRDEILRLKGYDAGQDLVERQRANMHD